MFGLKLQRFSWAIHWCSAMEWPPIVHCDIGPLMPALKCMQLLSNHLNNFSDNAKRNYNCQWLASCLQSVDCCLLEYFIDFTVCSI